MGGQTERGSLRHGPLCLLVSAGNRYARVHDTSCYRNPSRLFFVVIYRWLVRIGLPDDLRVGRLYFNVRILALRAQHPLHYRANQVFATREGLVRVETKTVRRGNRAAVWLSHVVQLSVQAACLAGLGRRVAPHGYVRLAQSSAPCPLHQGPSTFRCKAPVVCRAVASGTALHAAATTACFGPAIL